MRISKKFLLAAIALALVFCFSLDSVNAQGLKIGFVKDEFIKQEYKAWQRAQEQWELESKAWDDEAIAKQTELQELVEEYERQKLILSEDKKREKEASIMAKQEVLDAYTRQIYGPNGVAERKQAQLIQPLIEKVSEVIELIAIEENFDVIFTMQSGLGYIKETYDVTDKVLAKLEELED